MPAIIAIIAIILYIWLMYWLLTTVGPNVYFLVSLGVSLAIPIVYGRALFRVFGDDGWRNAALVPVVAILALVYFDFAFLNLFFGARAFPQAAVLIELFPPVSQVVFGSLVNRQILELLPGVPQFVGIPTEARILASVAIKSALLTPFLLVARGLTCKTLGKEQPAYLWYFHREAFPDLGRTIRLCVADLFALYKVLATGIALLVAGPQGIFFWPLALSAALALVPPVVIALVALTLLLLLHGLALALIWLGAMYGSLLLALIERSVIKMRSGYAKCPHAGCHQPVPLPVLHCPGCSAAHDKLMPGRFGVFRRRCRCGKRLPTLFWLGKGRLFSRCPRCRKPMREELFGDNVHVPIYGGQAAGKTMLMMALTWRLLERHLAGVDAALIEEAARRNYRGSWKADFESGVVRPKTAETLPDAFLLSVRRQQGLPVSLYLYDPSGEVFQRGNDLPGHRFIGYYDGMALVIDPLSLPRFAERYYRQTGAPDLQRTTSPQSPFDVLDQIVNQLESQAGLARERSFARPLAVIVSKADIPIVDRELGVPATDPGDSWEESGAVASARVRAWLARYEPNLVQLLETRFRTLRFFAVSALGHLPQQRGAFRPEGTLLPLTWLLSTRRVLARPRQAKLGVRALEVAAVAAILLVFLGLPVWALSVLVAFL